MRLSNNFTMAEFCASDTARRLRIVNLPSESEVENLRKLVINVLQPLRDKYGKPLHVNSGYRCPPLNRAVGGVSSSQHLRGEAADISCDNPAQLLKVLKDMNISFDQAILYPTFLHISYRSVEKNRGNVIIKK